MASAKRLESGSWRVQVKKVIEGKTVKKSFTASPKDFPGDAREASRKAKAQAELLARNWIFNAEKEAHLITVKQAMDIYISKKESALSESTMKDYYNMPKHFIDIHEKDINSIDNKIIQSLIDSFIRKGLNPKTIRNRINFLIASLDFSGIDKRFRFTIPKAIKPILNPPEPSEFHRLLSLATPEEKLTLILAGLYTLRRGEICGLKGEDMLWDLNSIYIHTSRVRARIAELEFEWIRRPLPKNSQSVRVIKIDPEIMKLFPRVAPDEYLIKMNPDDISKHFRALRAKACVNCRFHDLRKYAASIRSEIMPTKYVEADGGWGKGSKVLKTIYDKPFNEKRDEYSKKFNDLISNEYKKELFGS